MNHDIEWLFEEVYKIKKAKSEDIQFISDWDVNGEVSLEFGELLKNVYSYASINSQKYNYAYEQFGIKATIIELLHKQSNLKLTEPQLAITPSATISIYLTAQALASLGIQRVLIITPAYFSTHESFEKAGCKVFYYHLTDDSNLAIDFSKLDSIIKEQFIEGIILTDPVYSAGIEFTLDDYTTLSSICDNHGIYFIVDYSLGGLQWNNQGHCNINANKIRALSRCSNYLFLDTLPKRLLLNGIKFSLIVGDEKIIDKIDLISETVYGGLSSVQCSLINELYKIENSQMIDKLCKQNIDKIMETYRLIKSILIGTEFNIVNTNSGYFSLINHNKLSLESIDTRAFSLGLLKELKVLCLTKDRFTYFSSNKFGFRVNLNKPADELILPLRQCIGIDYSRFNKGK